MKRFTEKILIVFLLFHLRNQPDIISQMSHMVLNLAKLTADLSIWLQVNLSAAPYNWNSVKFFHPSLDLFHILIYQLFLFLFPNIVLLLTSIWKSSHLGTYGTKVTFFAVLKFFQKNFFKEISCFTPCPKIICSWNVSLSIHDLIFQGITYRRLSVVVVFYALQI